MLLVVDMQKQFTRPEGADYYPESRDIVGPIRRLVAHIRELAHHHGMPAPITWVYDVHEAGHPDFEFQKLPEHGLASTVDSDPDPDLMPAEAETVVTKRRFSAFFGTDFDLRLRERGVETVVIVGNKTNVCVRATATDAMGSGYRVRVVRECTASNRHHLHEANLEDIDRYIGEVIGLEQAEALFRESISGADPDGSAGGEPQP